MVGRRMGNLVYAFRGKREGKIEKRNLTKDYWKVVIKKWQEYLEGKHGGQADAWVLADLGYVTMEQVENLKVATERLGVFPDVPAHDVTITQCCNARNAYEASRSMKEVRIALRSTPLCRPEMHSSMISRVFMWNSSGKTWWCR